MAKYSVPFSILWSKIISNDKNGGRTAFDSITLVISHSQLLAIRPIALFHGELVKLVTTWESLQALTMKLSFKKELSLR